MTIYLRNRRCRCVRCRIRGLTGAAILITLGFLFLLDQYRVIYFDNSWPVLLIVIGLLSFAARSASTEGHVQPLWMGVPPQAQGQGDPRQAGTAGTGPQQAGPNPHEVGDSHR